MKNDKLSYFTNRLIVATIALDIGLGASDMGTFTMALLTAVKPTFKKLADVGMMDVLLMPLFLQKT